MRSGSQRTVPSQRRTVPSHALSRMLAEYSGSVMRGIYQWSPSHHTFGSAAWYVSQSPAALVPVGSTGLEVSRIHCVPVLSVPGSVVPSLARPVSSESFPRLFNPLAFHSTTNDELCSKEMEHTHSPFPRLSPLDCWLPEMGCRCLVPN